MSKYLAVHKETGEHWIEESDAIIDKALVQNSPIRFYKIILDVDNNASLGAEVRDPITEAAA